MLAEVIVTCLDCSSLISSDAFIPFKVINLITRVANIQGRYLYQNVPSDHFTPSFPILTSFEPRVTGDKFLKNWVQLILSTET